MGDIVEFVTYIGHEKIFYEVTGNAINFEVKAVGNVAIALGKHIDTEGDFLIVLGDNQSSWIQSFSMRDHKEKADTPNIVSMLYYRRFWISWYGDAIRLGGEGFANPIVTYDINLVTTNKVTELKYATFFVLPNDFPTADHAIRWRVELPPVVYEPTIKSITGGELNWVPIDANTDTLPNGSLIGGFEKENLYIIRAKHRGSLSPGKFAPAAGLAYISWGGEAVIKSAFEILCGFNCTWVPCVKDKIPINAIIAGYSENIEHEKLYIGRAKYLNHVIPGKIQPSHKVCYISYGNKEIGVKTYEVLVNPEKTKYVNTINLPTYEEEPEVGMEDDYEDTDSDAGLVEL